MKNLLIGLGLVLITVTSHAQQIAKGFTAGNGQWVGFLEYKPTYYNVDPTVKHPLIIFLHGIGERGNGTSQIWSVAGNGIPRYIQNGNPMRFTWNGKTETFLVLSPQLAPGYADWVDFYIEELIAYAKTNLRIDTNRIILTGLSLGGGGVWHYTTSSLAHSQQLAAAAPVCGTCTGGPIDYKYVAQANLPLWAFHAMNDGTVGVGCTTSQVMGVNQGNPAIVPLMTLYSSGGHGIWDRAYDSLYGQQNPNIYEWFLGQNKSLPVNVLPVANAGPAVTISTATGMVNLSGTASTDADGNIVRYIWRKVAGPAAGTIVTPVSANGLTSVTGLTTPGSYVYELKVADERASTAVANVTVNVTNAVVSNIPPVTQAGSDIQTYTSVAHLNGSNTYDPDGNISSYQWTKISGPAIYTISSTTVPSPDLTFLMLGDYAFQLRSTDNAGASTMDTVYIRSTASALPVQWLYFNAHNTGTQNKLVWATESQYENKEFAIERSVDGINYNTIGKVDGAGTSVRVNNYEFNDNFSNSGKTFYRIRQVGTNGKSTYSTVATINGNIKPSAGINHFPNPAQKYVTVTVNKPETGMLTIGLYSMDGKMVMQQQLLKGLDLVTTILDVQKLTKGTYLMRVSIGTNTAEVRKLIKQ